MPLNEVRERVAEHERKERYGPCISATQRFLSSKLLGNFPSPYLLRINPA